MAVKSRNLIGLVRNISIIALVSFIALFMIVTSVWFTESCNLPSWRKLIDEVSAGSCLEFWFYRYQTLMTGIAALVAAWLTVWAIQRQAEQARADQADRTLADYAIAIALMMQRYQAVTSVRQHETMQQAERRLHDLDLAVDDVRIRAGMIDSILGGDRQMFVLFVNCCRLAARARLYAQEEDLRQHGNLVWPLYIELNASIERRRTLLRQGASVNSLHSLSTIDHNEMQRAFTERRTPRLNT